MTSEIKNCLILCLPGVGDSLMATPMIRLLKENKKYTNIDVLCMFNGVKTVFKNNPYIRNIHQVSLYNGSNLQSLKALLKLRQLKYDLSILAYPAFRKEYHIIQFIIGAKLRVSHSYTSGKLSELHFLNNITAPANENFHNVENNLNLLQCLNIDWEKSKNKTEYSYDFALEQNHKKNGANFISKKWGYVPKKLYAIHPGSTQSPAALAKRWPHLNYFNVIDQLINNNDYCMIFFGPDEFDLFPLFNQKYCNHKNVLLVNNLNLEESLGVLSHSTSLLTNDNGFGHLSVALKIPTLVLYGPTEYKWSSPYSPQFSFKLTQKPYQPWHKYELKRKAVLSAIDCFGGLHINEVLSTLIKISDSP